MLLALALPETATTLVVLAILANVWLVVVYGGVVWNSLEQGLHDKAAGTIVVLGRSPLPAVPHRHFASLFGRWRPL